MFGGKALGLQGFISQTLQYSTKGDHYDTEQDLNAALTNLFLEADYKLNPDWKLYGAAMISVDWIYQIKHDDHSWERKQFDRAKDDLNVDDKWWQIVKEFHVTWNPGNFFLRVGKQRVGWGEMETFAVNDLINPIDQTRGYSEVELETLFVPIPLIRADYDFDATFGPVSDLNLQFIFNPNPDFIGNQGTFFGNDGAGIWAIGYVEQLLPVPWLPGLRVGRQDVNLDVPTDWSEDSFEYGLKLSSIIGTNTLFSLMAFYGRANIAPASLFAGFAPDSFSVRDDDGNFVVNLRDTGFYPRQKFVGFALASQLPVKVTSLGGVEPLLRLEGSYQADNVYFDLTGFDFVETDQFVLGVNAEYKIRVPWQRQFIYIILEAQYNDLLDYKSAWDLSPGSIYRGSFWNYSFWFTTGYFRGEWAPAIWWYAFDDANVQRWTPSLTYYHSDTWKFVLMAHFFTGPDVRAWGIHNKSHLVFKATYMF
jgi:hypothetical protein